jgi:V/A-type H+-transporting ATPase subunit K
MFKLNKKLRRNIMDFGQLGPILALGLGAIGSAVGCGIAGMTSHGVMAKTDEGHGLFIALSAMPASQTIYGFVLMILLQGAQKVGVAQAAAGETVTVSSFSLFSIGLAAGLALMMSAIFQGKTCSSAILGVAKKPTIAGKSFIAPGIVESFALFAMIGGILLMG